MKPVSCKPVFTDYLKYGRRAKSNKKALKSLKS